MKGEALAWYKWMYHNSQLTDWPIFCRALELRFGPSTYENHQAQLFKLKQTGTVSEYQTQFEKLGNRVLGLPSDALLNCFISGLSPEIRNEIAIQRPFTITQAIGLAKLIEAKVKDAKPKYPRPFTPSPSTYKQPTTTSTPNPTLNSTRPTSSTNPTTSPTPNRIPIRRITPTQRDERRAQGLCYNCNEKFAPGHNCSTGRFLLLMHEEGDIESVEEPFETELPSDNDEVFFQLSPQALTGQFSPQTLRFKGLLDGLAVSVLMDTGSDHNILQSRIATHLRIPSKPAPNFSVMVGNGSHLHCTDKTIFSTFHSTFSQLKELMSCSE